MAKILRVVGQTEPTAVRRKDGTEIQKSTIRLKELGGDYANEYSAAVFGNLSSVRFDQGEVVAAELSFSIHESNGGFFQDVTARDVVRIKN